MHTTLIFFLSWAVCFGLLNLIIYTIRLYLRKIGRLQAPHQIAIVNLQNFAATPKAQLISKIKQVEKSKAKGHPSTNLFK